MFALAFWTESQKSLVLAIALVWRRDSSCLRHAAKGNRDIFARSASGLGGNEALLKSPEPKTLDDWSTRQSLHRVSHGREYEHHLLAAALRGSKTDQGC